MADWSPLPTYLEEGGGGAPGERGQGRRRERGGIGGRERVGEVGSFNLPWYLFHHPEGVVMDTLLQFYLLQVQDHVLVVVRA